MRTPNDDFDFYHALAVAARVSSPDAKIVALLHDTVEDGVLTDADLGEIVQGDLWSAVMLLTRPRDLTYADYIERMARAEGYAGALAREVKRADLSVNLARCDAGRESLRVRYEKALAVLGETELASAGDSRE